MSDLISDPTDETCGGDCELPAGHEGVCSSGMVDGTHPSIPDYSGQSDETENDPAPSVSSSAPTPQDFEKLAESRREAQAAGERIEAIRRKDGLPSSAEPAPPTNVFWLIEYRENGQTTAYLREWKFYSGEGGGWQYLPTTDAALARRFETRELAAAIIDSEAFQWNVPNAKQFIVEDHRNCSGPTHAEIDAARKPENASLSPVQEEATPTPSSALGSNESVIRTAEHGEVAARFGVIVAQPTERPAADLSGDNVGHDAQHETQLSVGESNTVMLGHGNSLEGSTLSMRNVSGNRPPDPIDPPIINDLSASMFVLTAMHDSLAEKDGVVVWWQAGRDSMTHRASAETVRQATARIAQLENDLRGSISERETLTAALQEIDAIRNSIVGTQTVNWSAHIYPLVAALGKAGFVGLGYEKAKAEASTLIQQRDEAEAAVARLTTENTEAKAERDKFRDWFQNAEQARAVAIAERDRQSERAAQFERDLEASEVQRAELLHSREQAIHDIEALPSMRLVNMDNREVIARDEVRRILREAPTNG